jgi:predicted amidohydrolase
VNVAGIQCDLAWEDPAANRAALLPRIEAAAAAGARLVALPEMWPTGFSMRAQEFAEAADGPSETFLRDAATRLGIALGGSVARRDPAWPRPRNVFVLATADGRLHRYAKIHTFTYGAETEHYDAGSQVVTVEIDGVRVTPLVCYDLRFAELFAATAERTDLFVVVANWPEARAAHWRALLLARAIENQCYVLGVNRVGEGGGLTYRGDSLLVSPLGEPIADPAPGSEALVTGTVSPDEVASVRARFGFLADRRPDVYRSA